MIIKDLIVPGVIIGLLADMVKLTLNYLCYLMNFTPVVFWQITASRFLDKNDLTKPVAYLIGAAADLTVSAVLGILFVYFIHYLGSKYLWLKGIGFAMSVWVLLFGSLLGQSATTKIPQKPAGILVTLAAHLIYGVALAYFTRLLQRKYRI